MKIFFNTMLLSLLLLLSACSNPNDDAVITSYADDLNSSTIIAGRTLQISVYANYSDGTQKDVTQTLIWSSLDESVATVESGLVRAVDNSGEARINYKSSELLSDGSSLLDKTVNLTITDVALSKIKLSQTSLTLNLGASKSVQAIGVFEDGSKFDITDDCQWSSVDTNVSTVQKGLVTAVSEGNTTITASDENLTSDILSVEVIQSAYTDLNISSDSTDFNVKQVLTLHATVTTSNNETITLDADEVIYSSDNEEIVTVDTDANATAISKGSATITAKLKRDTTLESTLVLNVKKDKYMRLFKDGIEISFPNTEINEYETLPEELSKFTMIAVGKDFIVSGAAVRDFSNNITLNGWFDNLNVIDEILQDENRTFELMHNGREKELHYYFKIDDDFDSEFSEKYKADN